MPISILMPATMLDASSQISALSASSRSRASFGSSLPPSNQAATKRFQRRSITARSLSSDRRPWTVANRSLPLEAKVAMARSPRPSSGISAFSFEVKNQIGP